MIIAATLMAPETAAGFGLACVPQTTCQGQTCHQIEAGLDIGLRVIDADGATPLMVSDMAEVPVRMARHGQSVQFDGTNQLGGHEMLTADLATHGFVYVRSPIAGQRDALSYRGHCEVAP